MGSFRMLQGEEAKVIIISTTRNNPAGNIGFLKMKNRINVLISRAQHGMWVLPWVGVCAALCVYGGAALKWVCAHHASV